MADHLPPVCFPSYYIIINGSGGFEKPFPGGTVKPGCIGQAQTIAFRRAVSSQEKDIISAYNISAFNKKVLLLEMNLMRILCCYFPDFFV